MIDVLILNYNDAETTVSSVNRLKEYAAVRKILVVDNKSTNDSLSVFHEEFDGNGKIEVISAERNGGYGSGNNLGIRYLYEKCGAEYILLANPDTIIEEDVLIRLEAFLKAHPDYALAAPFMCNPRGEKQYNSAFRIRSCFLYAMSFEMVFSKLFKPNFYKGLEASEEEFLTVDGLSGSLFLMDAKAMYEHGMFDENVFLYAEEIILSMRLRAAGKKLALLPRLTFIHNHSVSISKTFKSEVKKQSLCLTSQKYVVKTYYRANPLMRGFAALMAGISLLEHRIYYKLKKKS